MKLLISISLFGVLLSAPVAAQTFHEESTDTLQLTTEERLDTLVKFVRKQFYANHYDRTIEIGEETLKLAKEVEYNKAIFRVSSLMGNAFIKIEDSIQAKRIFNEALDRAESVNDSLSIITAQIDLGNYYALRDIVDPALILYKESIPLAEKLNDTTHLFILNFNITELLLDKGKIETAGFYLEKTKKYSESLKAKPYHAGVHLLEGRRYYLSDKFEAASKSFKECIALSEDSGFTDGLIEGYDLYAKSQSKLGNHQKAFDLIQEAYAYKDDKYKKDKIEAVETVTARFKLDQYKQEIKAQEAKNEYDRIAAKRETRVLWIKIASGILLLFSIFLFLSDQKRKRLLRDLIDKNAKYLKAKERSELLSKEKSILFANITHELRTPMYGIIGTASLLMQDKNIKGQKENLASLKFSANYLLALINNVLQLTKIESTRKEELEKVELNIEELIQNAVSATKYIDSKHPNKYEIKIDSNVPERLIGDEVKLSQVFMNLIGNSAKFTQNGYISIRIKRLPIENGKIQLHFEIEDTGQGIPEEKLGLIFNEFADTGSGTAYRGTGLGLPIVKKILDLHNSKIEIESELDEGTRISFVIDFDPAVNLPSKKEEISILDYSVLKHKTILVVDDNKINQIVTSKILKGYQTNVLVASSGPEAIDLVLHQKVDLILMDINMPIMNGFETTERIREFNKDIPIIALTAVEIEKVTEATSFELMNDYIIKPYQKERFVETLSKYLSTIPV
ncbi:MAG: response regulator [Flavobacteriaceae bacterium]|nr:response regulator [Flavobacteriaceae bacterium]